MRALWQRHGHDGDNVGNRLLQFDSWQPTELHDQLQTREEVGIADNHINQHIDYCLQREHVTKDHAETALHTSSEFSCNVFRGQFVSISICITLLAMSCEPGLLTTWAMPPASLTRPSPTA